MKRLIAFVAVAALALAACSSSVEDATEAYCDDLETLAGAIASVNSLSATSSVDDFQDTADDISDAFDDVRSSAADVEGAVTDEIDSARSDFRDAVEDIDSSESLAAGIENVQAAAVAYVDAVNATLAKVDCSSSS
jgi:ABC-type transporter Mla subunit MlaD